MRLARGFVALLAACLLGSASGPQITVKLIAINDFHGYLQPSEKFAFPDPADALKTIPVPAGGAAYLATAIANLKAANPLNAVVGAGDMIGASPLGSALFHDEPAVQALSDMGLEYTSVGNHEFDRGRVELLRMQNGGCLPGGKIGIDTCLIGGRFGGARYTYLAANVIDDATGKTLFPPYAIKYFDAGNGKRAGIAFIGVVLQDTASVTTASGIRGLRFTDEAAAINALLPAINARGVHAVVVLIHQGITTQVGYDDPSCGGANGDLLPILDKLDPSIRLVVSGHTHRAYLCPAGQGSHNTNVFYTSAGRYGQLVSDINVTLDVASDTIAGITARNRLVINDTAPDPIAATIPAVAPVPAIAALVSKYIGASAPLVNRVIGKITTDLTLDGEDVNRGGNGESTMLNVVADSRLAASTAAPQSATLAFINAGGVRAPVPFTAAVAGKAPGDVTFGELYSVTPFGDILYTQTMTGAQILSVLDQQWIDKKDVELLGIAGPLTYTWDAGLPDGKSKVVPGSVLYMGKPIDPKATFRVTIDAFLMEGGDKFFAFRDGTNRTTGPLDLDALDAYVAGHSPLAPPQGGRIVRLH